MVAGVCGGLSDYLNIDSTIIRVIAALFFLFTFSTGVVIYLVLALVLPYDKDVDTYSNENRHERDKKTKLALGLGLVLYGAYLMADRFVSWIDITDFLPIAVIAFGLYLIIRGRGGKDEEKK